MGLIWGLTPALAFGQNSTGVSNPAPIIGSSENFRMIGEISPSEAKIYLADLETFRFAMLDILDIAENAPDEKVTIHYVRDSDIYKSMISIENSIAFYTKTNLGPLIFLNGTGHGAEFNDLRPAYFMNMFIIFRTLI